MIIAENIVKKYGKKTVINNLTFTIADGEKVVLSGKSGIGKTTLLRMISGLEKSDSGRLYGYDKNDISYMFQEPRLLPWETLFSNVITPVGEVKKQEAMDILACLDLEKDIDKYPDELSGGMKQRAALARAIIYDKPILLLDEPFASIDEKTKTKAVTLINKYIVGKTVVLVSHNNDDYKLVFGDNYKCIDLG